MMAGSCGRWRLAGPAFALVLLLAAAPAHADSPPSGDIGGGGAPGVAPPQDQPATAPAPAAPEPAPATPPAAAKKAEPPPPKNLETLEPGEATGLLGKKVRDAAGEDMGLVVDVLVDSDGRPRAAVIDFGGFLGVGSRKIAVDWRLLQLKPVDTTMTVLLSLTRADVQAAPEYKPSSSPGQPVVVVGPPPPSPGAPASSDAPK
jgi:PRC-barrel domain